MKTLYLHVGTPKTATSSIQTFLTMNSDKLMKYNYAYPETLEVVDYISPHRNGHFLIMPIRKEDGTRDIEAQDEKVYAGMARVHELFKQVDNVILSDESLWRVTSYSRTRVLPMLQEMAKEHGYQIKVIVYLRRQDQFLSSRWNQNVKSSVGEVRPLGEHLKVVYKTQKMVVNYASKLDQLAELFGKENIIVRRFNPATWVNNSIIHDFMHYIGLDVKDDLIMPGRLVNPGLKGNTVEIKRMINKAENLSVDEKQYLCASLLAISDASGERYPAEMLSVEETQKIVDKFHKQNERVANEYIKDGNPLFDETVKENICWDPENPYMREDMLAFVTEAIVRVHRENLKMQEKLQKQNQEIKDLRVQVKQLTSVKWRIKQFFKVFARKIFRRK